jgi:hypothetical protein
MGPSAFAFVSAPCAIRPETRVEAATASRKRLRLWPDKVKHFMSCIVGSVIDCI